MHTQNELWRIYQDICQRVEALYAARTWMMRHLVAYLVGMATMRSTLMLLGDSHEAQLGLLLAGAAWTAGMMIHLAGYVLYELQERTIAAQAGLISAQVAVKPNIPDDYYLNLHREMPPVQFYDEQGRLTHS